ncbi:hypothetical protein HPT25_28170 [Bacillus sp. BRMEA1]|uniref:hypothetical protein n=1 Tax=Neobacillus endophyticus TaxID=2738405 RepID=UPI0015651051|nr:hypothetical protein [Neobacillus endophyticus]NRD81172.1 hypothetical protein [Neobacillus endophyticus]
MFNDKVTVLFCIPMADWFYLQNMIMNQSSINFRDIELLNNLFESASVEMETFTSFNIDDDDLPL